MEYTNDPSFLSNNFAPLQRSYVSSSHESVKKSGIGPTTFVVEGESPSSFNREQVIILVEENKKMKELVEQLRLQIKQKELERNGSSINDKKVKFQDEELLMLKAANGDWQKKVENLENEKVMIATKLMQRETEIEEFKRKISMYESQTRGFSNDNRVKELEQELTIVKSKLIFLESEGPRFETKIVEKRVEVPVERIVEKRDDRRIMELESELSSLRSKISIMESQGPKIIEKRVEVPVERIVEKRDDKRIMELESELSSLRSKIFTMESQGPKIIEKRVEVPVERIVEKRDDRRIMELESELSSLRSKIFTMESQGPKIIEKRVEVPVERIVEKRDDRRIMELESELSSLRSKIYTMESQGPKIIEKRVEVPVERIVEKRDDRRIMELESELSSVKSKLYVFETQGPRVVEKRVEVPVEKIVEKIVEKRDDRRIMELESEVSSLRTKLSIIESQGPKIIEKRIEVPVERIIEKRDDRRINQLESELSSMRSRLYVFETQPPKVIEKRIEVPVERVVEKRVEVPYERVIEKPIEVIKYIDRPVEKIIEKRIEVPVEKIVFNDTRIRELELAIRNLSEENDKLHRTLEDWKGKLMMFEQERNHSEKVKRSAHQDINILESEMVRLKQEIEVLRSRPPEIVERVVEKIIEKPVPFEVIKEHIVIDEKATMELNVRLMACNEEIRRLTIINEEMANRIHFLENQPPPVILEKKVEVPVEILTEKIVMANDKVLRELEQEVNFHKAENRKMKGINEEWKTRVADLELQLSREKVIEKRVEVPVIKEKLMIDEERTSYLERQIHEMTQDNIALKEELEGFHSKLIKFEEDRANYELLRKNSVNYENEIIRLKKEIERLVGMVGPELKDSTKILTLVTQMVEPRNDKIEISNRNIGGSVVIDNQERIEASKKSAYRPVQSYRTENIYFEEPRRDFKVENSFGVLNNQERQEGIKRSAIQSYRSENILIDDPKRMSKTDDKYQSYQEMEQRKPIERDYFFEKNERLREKNYEYDASSFRGKEIIKPQEENVYSSQKFEKDFGREGDFKGYNQRSEILEERISPGYGKKSDIIYSYER